MSLRTAQGFRATLLDTFRRFGRTDAAVIRVVARWVDNPATYVGPDLVAGWWGESGLTFNLAGILLSVPARLGKPAFKRVLAANAGAAEMEAWGLEQLGQGAWDLSPSIQQPARFHGFFTIVDVPDPAPWEPNFIVPGMAVPS
jgi:hypothetical protein